MTSQPPYADLERHVPEDAMKIVHFRGGRMLARLFLVLEPIVGLKRAQAFMVWLIQKPPFRR